MKDLFYQTKQAFYFDLGFFVMAIVLFALDIPFAPIIFSLALLLSLLWIGLVMREIIFSTIISSTEKLLITLLLVIGNIAGGIVYFWMLRKKVTGKFN